VKLSHPVVQASLAVRFFDNVFSPKEITSIIVLSRKKVEDPEVIENPKVEDHHC
jgi:hypothetical protein